MYGKFKKILIFFIHVIYNRNARRSSMGDASGRSHSQQSLIAKVQGVVLPNVYWHRMTWSQKIVSATLSGRRGTITETRCVVRNFHTVDATVLGHSRRGRNVGKVTATSSCAHWDVQNWRLNAQSQDVRRGTLMGRGFAKRRLVMDVSMDTCSTRVGSAVWPSVKHSAVGWLRVMWTSVHRLCSAARCPCRGITTGQRNVVWRSSAKVVRSVFHFRPGRNAKRFACNRMISFCGNVLFSSRADNSIDFSSQKCHTVRKMSFKER